MICMKPKLFYLPSKVRTGEAARETPCKEASELKQEVWIRAERFRNHMYTEESRFWELQVNQAMHRPMKENG